MLKKALGKPLPKGAIIHHEGDQLVICQDQALSWSLAQKNKWTKENEMKLLVMGDQHIDNSTIKTRKDNVLAACADKLGQIFQIAKSHKVEAILQPGDFFESHKANDFLKQWTINFLKSDMANIPVYTVFGQHDLRFHSSNTNNTPLKSIGSSRE